MKTDEPTLDLTRTPTVRLNREQHEAGGRRAMREATRNVLDVIAREGGAATPAHIAGFLRTSRLVVEGVLRDAMRSGRVHKLSGDRFGLN